MLRRQRSATKVKLVRRPGSDTVEFVYMYIDRDGNLTTEVDKDTDMFIAMRNNGNESQPILEPIGQLKNICDPGTNLIYNINTRHRSLMGSVYGFDKNLYAETPDNSHQLVDRTTEIEGAAEAAGGSRRTNKHNKHSRRTNKRHQRRSRRTNKNKLLYK